MSRRFFLSGVIKETICSYLSLIDLVNFRNALELTSLKHKILIEDCDKQITYCNWVTDVTYQIHDYILKSGSIECLANAVEHNDLLAVQTLITLGADVNKSDANGDDPLRIAAYNGFSKMITFLLKMGADINYGNRDGNNALILAVQENKYKAVQVLVQAGVDINSVNTNGTTALMIAAKKGYRRIVEYLFDRGANINKRDMDGKTALSLAMSNNQSEIIILLTEQGGIV